MTWQIWHCNTRRAVIRFGRFCRRGIEVRLPATGTEWANRGGTMVGVVSYGGYIPRLRLSRKAIVEANGWANSALRSQGKAERSMCNWDEDSVTMAVEAARDCLSGFDRGRLSALYFASTTMPFVDRQNSGIIAEALNLADAVATLDVGASQRAGTSGLAAALNAATATGQPVLFVAAEKRRTKAGSPLELSSGDGAAALLLGAENPIARLLAAHSVAMDFVDHYRGQGSAFDYTWEERWIRDEGYMKIVPPAVAAALRKAGLDGGAIDHFCMPVSMAKVASGIAARVGIPEGSVRDNLHAACGECGSAHSIVMLVHALQQAKPGQRIMVAGFGQGCDVLIFETTEALATLPARLGIVGALRRRREETNYHKFLAFNDLVLQEKGMRAEVDRQTALSTLYRKKDMLLGLIGGRCGKCGTVQFPKSRVCVNPNCNAVGTQIDHPFADMPGKVNSYTADNLTYTPDPPAHYGMVQFEEGGRMMIDFTDVDVGAVAVGMPMRMVFRVKEHDAQRGFTKYFWKAARAYGAGN